MKKKEKIVIIGSSVAAISAIESIRDNNKELSITVITKEKNISYSKPLISHLNITPNQFYYRDKNFYKKNNVSLIFDEAVLLKKNSVVLKSKRTVKYSKLILAIGGKPIIPDIKGINGKNVFTLTNFEDANKIRKFAKNKKNAVIIGCGMIGIKAAEFLKGLGFNITIVELMNRPFASVLDEKSGKMVADEIRKNAKLILNNSIVEIKNNECILKSGEKISAELVICAIGVVPNIDIAKKSGIKTNRGIVVDSFMMTSKENIYAVGDCVEAADILKGENRVLPIWPIAYRQGSVAGNNISGVKTKYEGGFVMNSVDIFGLPIITIGMSNENIGEEITAVDEKTKKYKKIIINDNKIVGAIFVGEISRAGIVTGLIRDSVDVSNFKDDLLKENFGYIYVPKEFRSKEVVPTEI
ncbi:MAG: FAD-dependent oxidoreductase [Elusimicrobia bacterium]|nr:FAD-dependent oxidoreductase [Elusimicrobiota bacterium]